MREAIDSTLSLIEGLEDRITIHKEYGDIPKIHCSPGQINQIFMNILNNAAEFFEDQGNIWITTSQEADTMIVTIRDDGKCIPSDNLSKIFDPFFTTKPVGSGIALLRHNRAARGNDHRWERRGYRDNIHGETAD